MSSFEFEVQHFGLIRFARPFVRAFIFWNHQQAELSKEEMKESVPSLKAKIAKHRPRVVCFVGKGIWVIVEAVFRKEVQDTFHHLAGQEDMANSPLMSPSTRSKLSTNRRPTNRRIAASKAFEWGLQEYKLVYTGLECKSFSFVNSCTITHTQENSL